MPIEESTRSVTVRSFTTGSQLDDTSDARLVRASIPPEPEAASTTEGASVIKAAPARLSFMVRGDIDLDTAKAWLSSSNGEHMVDLTIRQVQDGGVRLDGVVEPGAVVRVDLEMKGAADGIKIEVMLLGGGRIMA